MKRLFFAVDIKPGKTLLDAFENVQHTLRMEKINWVKPHQMHLTLAFLGDTEEDIIPGMAAGIENSLRQRHSFTLTFSGLGLFRNIHDPRVIWVGCKAEGEFQLIKTDIDQVLALSGFEAEDRSFSPHLTLGRIKFLRHTDHLARLTGLYKDVFFQTETIRQVVLYESTLKPDGPEYVAMHRFELK